MEASAGSNVRRRSGAVTSVAGRPSAMPAFSGLVPPKDCVVDEDVQPAVLAPDPPRQRRDAR